MEELQKLKTKIEIEFIDNLKDFIKTRYKLINKSPISKNEKEPRLRELKSLETILTIMKTEKTLEITIKS